MPSTTSTSKRAPDGFVCSRGCGCFFQHRCWGYDSHSDEDKAHWGKEKELKQQLHKLRVEQTVARLKALQKLCDATNSTDNTGTTNSQRAEEKQAATTEKGQQGQRKSDARCKCGSDKHTRTSHKDCPLNERKREDAKTEAAVPANRGLPSVTKARGKKVQPIPGVRKYEAHEHEEAAINARAYYSKCDIDDLRSAVLAFKPRNGNSPVPAPETFTLVDNMSRQEMLQSLVETFVVGAGASAGKIVYRKSDGAILQVRGYPKTDTMNAFVCCVGR